MDRDDTLVRRREEFSAYDDGTTWSIVWHDLGQGSCCLIWDVRNGRGLLLLERFPVPSWGAMGDEERGEPAADTTGVLCLDWPGPWSEGGWQRAKASLPRLLVQLALES